MHFEEKSGCVYKGHGFSRALPLYGQREGEMMLFVPRRCVKGTTISCCDVYHEMND